MNLLVTITLMFAPTTQSWTTSLIDSDYLPHSVNIEVKSLASKQQFQSVAGQLQQLNKDLNTLNSSVVFRTGTPD